MATRACFTLLFFLQLFYIFTFNLSFDRITMCQMAVDIKMSPCYTGEHPLYEEMIGYGG